MSDPMPAPPCAPAVLPRAVPRSHPPLPAAPMQRMPPGFPYARAAIAVAFAALVAGCATGAGRDPGSDGAARGADRSQGAADRPASAPAAPAAVTPRSSSSAAEGERAGPSATGDEAPAAPPTRAARTPAHPEERADRLPPNDLTPQVMFQVLAAEVAAQRGQPGNAAATYLSLAQQTRDPRLARRATELALSASADLAVRAAQLWHQLAPDSALATQTVESLWLATDRLTDAEPLIAARLAKARADGALAQAYPQLQRQLLRANDKAGALALLDRLSQPDERVPEARLALAALANAAGQPERAAAEAAQALSLRPDDERAVITTAEYVRETKLGAPGALQLLEGFLARKPKAVEARFTYARLLALDGKTESARDQMERALKDEPGSPAILYSLAQLAYQMKQPAVARRYLEQYLALPPGVQRDNTPAYLFLAQMAEEAKRYDEAIDWLARVDRGEQFLPALTQRALLMGRTKRVEQARELLRTTNVATNRERVQLTQAEAQVLREAQRYQEAYDVLDRALERLPNNPELLYDHGMAAERIDKLDVMEASLRKLMQVRPQNAHAYNALGYTFAERNIRLDEAQQLIEKALSIAPDDAHIIDSMGWVMYRKGDLPKAIEWLRRAYDKRPEGDIAAHLGEVLWRNGQAEEARTVWREARGREPENETLKETLARLNVSL